MKLNEVLKLVWQNDLFVGLAVVNGLCLFCSLCALGFVFWAMWEEEEYERD